MNVVVAILIALAAGALAGGITWWLFGATYAVWGAGPVAGVVGGVLLGRIYRARP